MADVPPESIPDLAAAASMAVARSRPVLEVLARSVESLIAQLPSAPAETTSALASTGVADPAGNALRSMLARERAGLADAGIRLRELIAERRTAADSFNLVLFGRTGVGKSSLIQALIHGDGSGISPGESDYTTDVVAVQWRGCRLYDTPGVGGWGNGADARLLAERARRAVLAADLVLLCFDDQNQLDTEFDRIAAWVQRYGKPAIAVLNVREHTWRHPRRERTRERRRAQSVRVAQGAGWIRARLAEQGLLGAPVIALHVKRAVLARTTDPYHGPYAAERERLRRDVGVDKMLAWSNLPALEELLTQAVLVDADKLRYGMLIRQIAAELERARDKLADRPAQAALNLATALEAGVEQAGAVVGLPSGAPDAAPASVRLRARIRRLERERGEPFSAGPTGTAHHYATDVLAAQFAPLREEAHRRAQSFVDAAMAAKREVTAQQFSAEVFDLGVLQAAAERVGTRLSEHVAQSFSAVDRFVATAVDAAVLSGAGVHGAAGMDERARVRRTVDKVSTAARTIRLGALLAPQLKIATDVVSYLVQIGVNIWARISRRAAERQRQKQFGLARAEARRAVNEAFDVITADLLGQCNAFLAATAARILAGDVSCALEARAAAARAVRAGALIGAALTALPHPGPSAADLLRAAAARCEDASSFPPLDAAPMLWLGESWCEDPDGLLDREGVGWRTRAQRRMELFQAWRQRRRTALPVGLFTAASLPEHGSGRAWLAAARSALSAEPAAAPMLAALEPLATIDKPRVLICGDYSTGKTSLLARLFIAAHRSPPPGLTVGAAPETAATAEYELGGLVFVDTPGFHSGLPDHTRTAREAAVGASAVLCVFSAVTPGGPDQADLRFVLRGDPESGVIGNADRAVFVLNRADELGEDPVDDPDRYAQLAGRRVDELARLLGGLLGPDGPVVDRRRIVAASSAPHGIPVRSAAEATQFAAWDGIEDLRVLLAALRVRLRENGVDVSILHRGVAVLTPARADAVERAAAAADQIEQRRRSESGLTAHAARGALIQDNLVAQLAATAQDYINRMIGDWLMESAPEAKQAILRRLERWSAQDEFLAQVEEWKARADREVAQWRNAAPRGYHSLTGALPGPAPAERSATRLKRPRGRPRPRAARAAGVASDAGGAMAVLRPGDFEASARLLHKSISSAIAVRAADAATILGEGLTVFAQLLHMLDDTDRQAEADDVREARRGEAFRRLLEQGSNQAQRVALGDERSAGHLVGLRADCVEARRQADLLAEQIAAHETARDAAERCAGLYTRLIAQACARLGSP